MDLIIWPILNLINMVILTGLTNTTPIGSRWRDLYLVMLGYNTVLLGLNTFIFTESL